MNQQFDKRISKEVHPAVRVTVSVVLCALGCLCSILWIVTGNPVLGLIGLLAGLPCMFMGVALLLGKTKQTKLSPAGLRLFGIILLVGGIGGIYNQQPYASLLIVFGLSCIKIAMESAKDNVI